MHFLLPPDPRGDEIAELASKLCAAIGSSHTDVALPALAAVVAAAIRASPAISEAEAVHAMAENIRGLLRMNPPSSQE